MGRGGGGRRGEGLKVGGALELSNPQPTLNPKP